MSLVIALTILNALLIALFALSEINHRKTERELIDRLLTQAHLEPLTVEQFTEIPSEKPQKTATKLMFKMPR